MIGGIEVGVRNVDWTGLVMCRIGGEWLAERTHAQRKRRRGRP